LNKAFSINLSPFLYASFYVAAILHSLGAVYTMQGKDAEAESSYRRSISIQEKTLGPDHSNFATTLKNYANLLRKTNREAEASKNESPCQVDPGPIRIDKFAYSP